MVNIYNLFDITLFIFICYFIYYSYKRKIYVSIFEYFKIFIIITISAKLASTTGIKLSKFGILQADTYTTLVLIGFMINFAILYFFQDSIFKFLDNVIKNIDVKEYFAKLITIVQVTIIVTFCLYIFMQLKVSKRYIYPTLTKTYSYPYIRKFYTKFLNDDFVNMVLSSDTGTNHKEILFKSFKNCL